MTQIVSGRIGIRAQAKGLGAHTLNYYSLNQHVCKILDMEEFSTTHGFHVRDPGLGVGSESPESDTFRRLSQLFGTCVHTSRLTLQREGFLHTRETVVVLSEHFHESKQKDICFEKKFLHGLGSL